MALFDPHANFAWSTVLVAPSPALSGTSLTVQVGDGAKFPAVPFNATVAPAATQPTTANAEIVRVTNIAGDVMTITRTQEASNARTIIIGDQIAATITVKTATDIEALAAGTSTITTTGTQIALALPVGSGPLTIFCNNATLLTIQGITAGIKGQRLNLFSIGAGNVLLQNKNGGAVTANQLANNPASDYTLVAGVMGTSYVYDATANFWRQDGLAGGLPADVAIGSILVSGGTTAPPKYTSIATNGQLLIGSTGADAVAATLVQGSGMVITNGAGSITIASATPVTLIGELDGTDTTAAATNVATFAISGLTAKDSLRVLVRHSSSGNTTAIPVLYSVTDSLVLFSLALGGALTVGTYSVDSVDIGVDQSAATAAMFISMSFNPDAGTGQAAGAINYKRTTLTTAWTGSWTLALRTGVGGVTAGGTYHYRIAVYKVAGQ